MRNKVIKLASQLLLVGGLMIAILPGIVDPVSAGDSVSTRTTPGTVFQESLRSGGMGPKMVVLPSGSFRMGCLSDANCQSDEKPVHEVRIARPFAVSVYEVTFEDYDRFRPYAADDNGWGRGRHPVINVSWKDAKKYTVWLSRQTGEDYRLLSESEWEYAARAGSRTKYSFGDRIGANRANYEYDRTEPVGFFAPNAFGLYDMHGNVWEWVEDCWNGSYQGAPSDGSAWLRGDCGKRVLRGGSWDDPPWVLRSAYRKRTTGDDRNSASYVGFRVARTLSP